jgi:preprotein translocase subunit SecE
MIGKVTKFFGEVKTEMSKVTWSSREELIHSAIIVLTVMVALAIFLGVVDFIFARLVHLFLR